MAEEQAGRAKTAGADLAEPEAVGGEPSVDERMTELKRALPGGDMSETRRGNVLREALDERAIRKGASARGFIVAPVGDFSVFPRYLTRGGMGIFDPGQRPHRFVARMIASNAGKPVPNFDFEQPVQDFLQRTGAIRVMASEDNLAINLAEDARASAQQAEAIAEIVERWDPTGEKRANGQFKIIEIGWGRFGPIEEEAGEEA